jgi:hypothetical protein
MEEMFGERIISQLDCPHNLRPCLLLEEFVELFEWQDFYTILFILPFA